MVFGCSTKPRYQEELRTIEETYRKHCDAWGAPLYVCVEENAGMTGPNYVQVPSADDSYESNLFKTYIGLKWLMDNVEFESVLVIGSDAYPNVPKILSYLKTLDMTRPLYIGGHGDVRNVYGNNIYFHSGGSGFILTRPLVKSLYPFLAVIPTNWLYLCMNSAYYYLRMAGDVSIAFYLVHFKIEHEIVKTPGVTFSGCNHRGFPCCTEKQKLETVMCCHLMKRNDMLEFTRLLEENNFYI